jgi:hypothetical protein
VALVRVQRLRVSARKPGVRGAIGLVGLLLVITILLCELPYRIFHHSQMERIEVDGERCYVIGQRADEWLIYCPNRPPPRNRTVQRTAPGVQGSGTIESIFTP